MSKKKSHRWGRCFQCRGRKESKVVSVNLIVMVDIREDFYGSSLELLLRGINASAPSGLAELAGKDPALFVS